MSISIGCHVYHMTIKPSTWERMQRFKFLKEKNDLFITLSRIKRRNSMTDKVRANDDVLKHVSFI